MVKKGLVIGLGIAIALMAIRVSAQDSPSSDIVGKWYAEELDKSVIEIKEDTEGFITGTITESANEDYVGKKVIYDCKFSEDEEAYLGTIYSVARKMEIDGRFTLDAADKLKIVGKKLFITETFYWNRYSD